MGWDGVSGFPVAPSLLAMPSCSGMCPLPGLDTMDFLLLLLLLLLPSKPGRKKFLGGITQNACPHPPQARSIPSDWW